MATAYSNAVAVGSYNRIRLRVDYSGTSASCHIEFSRTDSWTGQWADYNASITLNGTTQASPYDYSGTVNSTWREIASASGFTVPTAGGTLSWSFNNPTAGSVLGCSGTIDIPSQGSAPSGGYINNLTSYWDSTNNEIVVATTAAGVTSIGSSALTNLNWNITEQPYTIGIARIARALTNGSASALSNSLNEYTGTTISVLPNSTYYRGLFASNSVGDYRYNGGAFTTVCAPATVSLNSVTDTTATFGYSTPADGGVLSKTIEYSLDGSTWNTGVTVSTGSASSGTFTITNLTASTTYNVQTRVTTTSGSTAGATVAVTTSAPATTAAFYGSVSGLSKKIKKMYGPVSVTAYEATALTNNTGFDATTFTSKWESWKGVMEYPPLRLQARRATGMPVDVVVTLDRGGGSLVSYTIFTYTDGAYNDEGAVWGFASEPQNGVFTSTSTTKIVTKKITKLYASKNGVAKLVFEA